MINQFFTQLDTFFWGYVAFILIAALGFFLSLRAGFFQVSGLPSFFKLFISCLKEKEGERGVHPLKAFFASTGGMIGIGNVVGVATAVQLGGPGALLWLWVAGIIGAIVKYCEIYLGLKFRKENSQGGYDGGPMYFLRKAFKTGVLPIFVTLLLCIYGVEIYQFSVITDSISTNWHLNRLLVMSLLLGAILWASLGGVQRIGKICSWVVPIFLLIYLSMGMWVIIQNLGTLPGVIGTVFSSAFTGHAAVGGFAGSTMILAVQHGIARAAYSADIGIGYDSIIQSESSVARPEMQARLAILGVFIDNLICTITIFMVLLSGAWTIAGEGSHVIQAALSRYFPFMEFFLPFFYIATGYTTIIAYFCVGIKCARYLFPRFGRQGYILFGTLMFPIFSFLPQGHALLVMSLAGAMLLIVNLLGIFRLRKEISFSRESLSGSYIGDVDEISASTEFGSQS